MDVVNASESPVGRERRAGARERRVPRRTARSQRYLARAKARLELFDFVLVVEDLDAGYRRQLGWPDGAPHARTQKKPAPLPEKHRARILELNQLDVELYAFAVDLGRRFNARGPLSQFADVAPQTPVGNKLNDHRDCLRMRRAEAPITTHANDREDARFFLGRRR